MLKIKKDDVIIVLAGKDKGKTGKILKMFREKSVVLVEGINKVKKSQKRTNENQQGGFLEIERPIHISNISLVDKKLNKPTRIGVSFKKDGSKLG